MMNYWNGTINFYQTMDDNNSFTNSKYNLYYYNQYFNNNTLGLQLINWTGDDIFQSWSNFLN